LSNYAENYVKRILLTAVAFIIALSIQAYFEIPVYAQENTEQLEVDREEIIEEQLQSGETQDLQTQLEKYLGDDVQEILDGYDPQSIMKDVAKGEFEFNIKGILNRILRYLFKEIYANIDVLIKLAVLVILCSVLKNLQSSFLSESVGELAFYVCYMVIVSIMLVSFRSVMKLGTSIIGDMINFMYATIPALITLLVSGGNLTSGGVFQPVLVAITEIVATIFRNVLMPLIFFSTVLSIVNNISDKIQISKLAGFLKLITKWALGLTLTIFVGLVSVQGSLGAVVDGVTAKTAKFAIGAFIPVVGAYLSDAAETVIGCTLLIKNAAGIAVMVGIIGMCLIPLIKIFSLVLLYKITCVLIEPIAEKRITECLNEMAVSLTYILGIVASVAFMFLISITVIISASNLSAMIR
jgi:stage III sporulation protein AE